VVEFKCSAVVVNVHLSFTSYISTVASVVCAAWLVAVTHQIWQVGEGEGMGEREKEWEGVEGKGRRTMRGFNKL